MGEFGCVQTLTSMFGSLSEKQCIEEMWRDKSLLGVDYDPATKRCRGYYCDYGLGYHSGRTVYRKTCEIGNTELCKNKIFMTRLTYTKPEGLCVIFFNRTKQMSKTSA